MDEQLFGALELKYGAAFAQDVQDKLAACQNREIQYFDMKHMADIQFRFRERVRAMVNLYRSWKRDYEAQTDDLERVYKGYEGQFIRQQLRDALKLYYTVNKDYHEMYRTYMSQIEQKMKRPFNYEQDRKTA